MKDLYKQVENNMDDLVDNQVWWSNCATAEQMDAAKNGSLEITLGGSKPVPKDWIAHISGKKVLCLAGAGAGAKVTVMDISRKMLDKDILMAQKYDLDIRIEKGNMEDLSRFEDESFHFIVNPASLFYVPSVHPVFKECYRVLKKGGALILAVPAPIAYVCE